MQRDTDADDRESPHLVTARAQLAIAAIGLFVAMLFLRRYVKDTDVHAQLAAKDDAIKTNQQTIEAITTRLQELERTTLLADHRIKALEVELQDTRARYLFLEQFAAPKAFLRLMEMLDGHGLRLDALIDQLVPADQRQLLRKALYDTQTRRAERYRMDLGLAGDGV